MDSDNLIIKPFTNFTGIFPKGVFSFLEFDIVKIKDSLKNVQNYLLKEGTDVNDINTTGMSLLHIACTFNDIKTVKFLVENGAYINSQDLIGYTPLHYNILYCNGVDRDNVSEFLLIECDVDIHIEDRDGRSAYDIALYEKYTFFLNLIAENATYVKPVKKNKYN